MLSPPNRGGRPPSPETRRPADRRSARAYWASPLCWLQYTARGSMAASVPGHAIGEATMVHPRTTAALSASLSWIVLAGCATAFPPIEPQPLQTSDFVVYAGDSLVASERVNHYPDRIEGNIEVTGRARVSYLARLDSRNAIDHMEMQTWPWEGE